MDESESPSLGPRTMKTIGDLCKLIRTRHDMTQREWAKRLKITQGYVGQVEANFNRYPIEYLKSLRPYMTRDDRRTALEIMKKSLEQEIDGE